MSEAASGHHFDAIILGGGPGGSTAAWRLARAGKRALVIDHAKFPRVKVCAGWITPGALRLLELRPAEYPHTIQDFDGGTVVVDGQETLTTYGCTASFGIIRQEFDHYLLRRAEQSGARVLTGVKVRDFERDDQGVSVTVDSGESFRAPLLIGAGGSGCPVSRKWGERSKSEDIILAAESETKVGAETLKKLTPHYGRVELFAEPDFNGYGWFVPKGDWVNIGVGRFRSKTENFNEEKKRFFEMIKNMGRIAGIEDQLVDFAGHSYKLYDDTPRRLSGDRFVLIGDAGGFASRWAGEGIKPAIQTAIFAAELVLAQLASGDFSAAATETYNRRCRQTYGLQSPGVAGSVLRLLPDGFKRLAARQICLRPGLRKRFIFDVAFGFEPVAA